MRESRTPRVYLARELTGSKARRRRVFIVMMMLLMYRITTRLMFDV
jgi:hypothetical protein